MDSKSVLNRLYIVVGILAILILGAAFVVPRLMDWNDYRARLEALAEANLGTDVIIGGKIEFTLLPQPKIRFGKTFIGAAFSPMLEIDSIEAEFSLMDFLRDQFVITKLIF
ncbi:MAG: AsmA family protein, partial [Devosiaceae bacterium]|nr:AsmA family protein [Devosiaceae bacterium]